MANRLTIPPFLADTPWSPDLSAPSSALVPSVAPPVIAPMAPVKPVAPMILPPAQTQMGHDAAELSRLQATGSGISQINNPILHGLATIGDTLASTFLPRLAAFTPGTTAHHNVLVHEQEQRLANDKANATSDALLEHTKAQTRVANDQAAALEQPSLPDSEVLDTDQGKVLHVKGTTTTTPLTSESGDALTSPDKAQKWTVHDSTAGPILINDTTGEAKAVTLDGVPVKAREKVTQSQPIIGPDGKPHTYLLNESGEKVGDLGVHYEKPMSVHVSNGNAELDRESKQYGTAHQKAVDSANTQLEKIDEATNLISGNAEAQALGIPKVLTALVSGAGTGVRITQPELNAIARARGWTGNFEGGLNALAGKGQLTKTQQNQLHQILGDARGRILQKQAIASEALDTISTATDRDQIVAADRNARQRLTQLEQQQGSSGATKITRDGHGRIVGIE